MNTIANIKKELDDNKRNFLLLMKRVEDTYSQYKVNPIEDNVNTYNALQSNIDKKLEELYLIKNRILQASNDLAKNMMTKDEYISDAKAIKNDNIKALQKIQDEGGASIPRFQNLQSEFNYELYYAILQGAVLAGSSYLYYRLLTS